MKAAIVTVMLIASAPCLAEEKPRIAIFDFEMVNTSLAATTPEEAARIRRLGEKVRDAFAASGRYAVIDTAPAQTQIETGAAIRSCNGCELDYARSLQADQIAYGWVQKVSNLILNINLVIEDANGRKLHAGSVDIRGNTDESWDHGLRWLLRERMLREP